MDNTLAYIDQASFLGFRALGRGPLIQLTWIYDHEVDLEALRRFQHALGGGMLGRRIERSPLPFGRHRWVTWEPPADLDVRSGTWPRSELPDWVQQRLAMPLDAEFGPPWHLGVLRLDGGGAAVCLTVSHTVGDGVGIAIAVTAAVQGITDPPGYPSPHTRRRGRALVEDARQIIAGLPEAARGLVSAIRVARDKSGEVRDSVRKNAPASVSGSDSAVAVPWATLYVSAADWDERASSLGGTSNSLFLGVAARLGALFGRVRADGSVELAVPVNERTPGDVSGNALTGVTVITDPAPVTTDLRGVRQGFKSALSTLSEARHELAAPLPLTPLIPRGVARRLAGVALGSAAVIGCSNIGTLDPAVNRPDGTDAEYFSMRAMESRMSAGEIARQGGLLFLVCTRVHGQVSVTVSFSDPAVSTTRDELVETLRGALADFRLSGSVW